MRGMDTILNSDEFTEVENRGYLNPQVGLDESNRFIDQLRATQAQQNQQIAQDTYNLGSALPSAQGGLGTNTPAGLGYFTSRMQTPQTASAVANLRATAQATALNQALENEQAIWKKRYQDAYRAYQKRMNDKTNTPQNPYANAEGEDPEYETTTPEGTIETSVSGAANSYTVVDAVGNLHIVDMETGEEKILSPEQTSSNSQPAGGAVGGGTLRTLPNGNTVLVKTGYELTNENGKYYLVNQSTGAKTEVGGY